MQDLFKKIPVQIPKPLSLKGKRQSLLNAIRGDWCMKKMNEKLPPLNKQKLGKKHKRKKIK